MSSEDTRYLVVDHFENGNPFFVLYSGDELQRGYYLKKGDAPEDLEINDALRIKEGAEYHLHLEDGLEVDVTYDSDLSEQMKKDAKLAHERFRKRHE